MESKINQTMRKMEDNENILRVQEGYKTEKLQESEGVKHGIVVGGPLVARH
jgi:hypothetical protein